MSAKLLLAAAVVAACAQLPAQTSINGVRIYTEPEGLAFSVDGNNYAGAADLFWPTGSKHDITASSPQNNGLPGARYTLARTLVAPCGYNQATGEPIWFYPDGRPCAYYLPAMTSNIDNS